MRACLVFFLSGALAIPAASGRSRSVMLVLAENTIMGNVGGNVGCELMKGFAREFYKGLQPGGDALGAIVYRDSVYPAIPLSKEFESPSEKLANELASVYCFGGANIVYALEIAQQELLQKADPNSYKAIVLVAVGWPSAITANWPVRTQADARKATTFFGPPGSDVPPDVLLPPSTCADNLGRHYPEAGWATQGSLPDRPGVLIPMVGAFMGPLQPAIMSGLEASRFVFRVTTPTNCFFDSPGPVRNGGSRDLAFLPDTDLAGIPFSGKHAVVRFQTGPYQGKIRPDLPENVRAVVHNLAENAVAAIQRDGIHIFLVTAASTYLPKDLESIYNVPGTASFDPSRTAGVILPIHDLAQMSSALQRIWKAIGAERH